MSLGLSQAEVTSASYHTLRGMVAHRLMSELFGQPNWMNLTELSPRAFQNKVLDLAGQVECEITRSFLSSHPQEAEWLAGCYRILLKCLLRDWRISSVLVMEPQLPTILLPDGSELRCGVPDMMGDSQTFNGLVNVEMKTGLKRVRRHAGKLARYNGGASLFVEDHCLRRPFRGTIWISFSSMKIEKKSGRHLPSSKPELTYYFEPFNPQRINDLLGPRFGFNFKQAEGLPHHYNPQFV